MKNFRLDCAVVLLSLSPGLASLYAQSGPVALASVANPGDSLRPLPAGLDFLPDDSNLPDRMIDLMRVSHLRYQEGSDLIKSGASARARAAFDEAVESILRSEWDLSSNPVLNRFFQDLIKRIQHDESRYLVPEGNAEESAERAVVDELEKLDLIPITVDPSLEGMVEADLAQTKYDIPIVLNQRVLQSLNYWLNRGRKYFVEGLQRSGRYQEMIRRVFREHSLPMDLIYLAQVESLFKTNALSRTRNKGIWQFGTQTAVRYGLKVNSYVDERSDPEKSTVAAARYLSDLYSMFQDWNLVLAAYNWGEGHVLRLMNRSGLNDFWEMMDLRRNFPKETQNHVPLIQASVILARNPEKYGLPKELDSTPAIDTLAIAKPTDLRAAARILNISTEELKDLNPAIRRTTTPPNYPNFKLKIPAGVEPTIVEKIERLPQAKLEPIRAATTSKHKVKDGETLFQIAARYKVTIKALQQANHLQSAAALRIGMNLTIPGIAKAPAKKPASTASKTPKKSSSKAKNAGSRKPSSRTNTAQRAAR